MRAFLMFLTTFLLLSCGSATLLFLFDPLQLFHRPLWRDTVYGTPMHHQAAGILRREHYTGIILGNSYIANTSGLAVSKMLGGRFINVSLYGSGDRERKPVLELALRNPNIRDVIYQLDFIRHMPTDPPMQEWEYLYRPGIVKLRFYLKEKYIACLVRWMVKGCIHGFDYDDPGGVTSWLGGPNDTGSFGGLDKWVEQREAPFMKKAIERIDAKSALRSEGLPDSQESIATQGDACARFHSDILPYLQAEPTVRFHLIIPPGFRVLWHLRMPETTDAYLVWHRCIVDAAAGLPNVDMYGFENDDYADDVANYRDLGHFNIDMNMRMLESIRSGENRLSPENVDLYVAGVRQRIDDFDGEGFVRTLKKMLEDAEKQEAHSANEKEGLEYRP